MASPYPQPAWHGPAPLVPSALPSAVSRAVRLMRVGAALAVVYGVVYRARVLSSVFFGVMSAGLLGSVADRKWAPAFVVIVFLLEWGVGLAALSLVWRPESSQFFAAARQARLTAAAVPPYRGAADPAGTQVPGYGRLAEAIPLYEWSLTHRKQVLGNTHPDTLTSRDNLALAYRSAGRLAEAIALYERTLADREQLLGDTPGSQPRSLP